MIKPNDLTQDDAFSQKFAVELEEACDFAIREAHKTGEWPARVGRMRMQIPRSVVLEVAAKYAIWWTVATNDANVYMTIDRPV